MKVEKEKRTVLAAVDDLFFWAKIEAVAKGLGVTLVQAANAQKLEEQLETSTPDLIVLDLNSRACSPIEAIRRIKSLTRLHQVPLVAFVSHVQVELEQEARQAGCETIMPRSAFTKNLKRIIEAADH